MGCGLGCSLGRVLAELKRIKTMEAMQELVIQITSGAAGCDLVTGWYGLEAGWYGLEK